ncbi:uncharacterized protein MONBRDRAFT_8199 [Monosiga brevicollis MX1]|uniref:Uncharacterized protein n=1 Tax=Monosiga brevicollis TaxID=81824 RepID=A9UZC3_MONBE|nr:uncharacterized protein MONBRDRAFT_8199 [Monosiga brevicollis MX1]EDQ89208.1 predicted protein [Monosiga brevicollis MX1]|eukprot:XP_001745784.1 hypothetical protein [Monosiga brevicollis MX1]
MADLGLNISGMVIHEAEARPPNHIMAAAAVTVPDPSMASSPLPYLEDMSLYGMGASGSSAPASLRRPSLSSPKRRSSARSRPAPSLVQRPVSVTSSKMSSTRSSPSRKCRSTSPGAGRGARSPIRRTASTSLATSSPPVLGSGSPRRKKVAHLAMTARPPPTVRRPLLRTNQAESATLSRSSLDDLGSAREAPAAAAARIVARRAGTPDSEYWDTVAFPSLCDASAQVHVAKLLQKIAAERQQLAQKARATAQKNEADDRRIAQQVAIQREMEYQRRVIDILNRAMLRHEEKQFAAFMDACQRQPTDAVAMDDQEISDSDDEAPQRGPTPIAVVLPPATEARPPQCRADSESSDSDENPHTEQASELASVTSSLEPGAEVVREELVADEPGDGVISPLDSPLHDESATEVDEDETMTMLS